MDTLRGKLVRLQISDPETYARLSAPWNFNSQFNSLADSSPATLYTPRQIQEHVQEEMEENFSFDIYTLDGDVLIGGVGLDGVDWVAGHTYVGIGVGDPEYWGRGYGSEAMDLVLRFAFVELNLQRVSLDVFEFNERACRSYRGLGFVEEGRVREWMCRGGRRWDLIYMGLLREDWLKAHPPLET